MIYYLTHFPNIGTKTAEKIADHYGTNTLEGILANPDFIASLPRFNRTKAEGLAELITTKIEVQSTSSGAVSRTI